jgi:glucosamine kinase
MAGALYLGIDGGGTTSRARLADEAGRVLAEAQAGSSNLTLGIETAAAALQDVTTKVLQAASLGEEARARLRAGLGLAGANVPSLATAIRATAFGFAAIAVASDAVAACLGAHGGQDGAILILGTGSQGLALIDGVETAIGGWGFAISDDGSGAILGRAGLRAAVLALDGLGPATGFTEEAMARFGGDPAAAVLWSKTATPRDYGTFAPLVFGHAAKGDGVARTLVEASAASVTAMIDRLLALGARRVALMGGLAEPHRAYLPARLAAHLVAPAGDAMDGALALARRTRPA